MDVLCRYYLDCINWSDCKFYQPTVESNSTGQAGGSAFSDKRNIKSEELESNSQRRSDANEGRKQDNRSRRGKPRKNALMKFKVMTNNVRGYK